MYEHQTQYCRSIFYLRLLTILIGLHFVDLVSTFLQIEDPNIKPYPSPLTWLFQEFTECINIKLNASILYLRLLTILIMVFIL